MMRLWGAVLLLAGTTSVGICALRSMNGRVKDLNGLICALEGMKRALTSREESLGVMLRSASVSAQGRVGVLFQALYTGIENLDGEPFCCLWEKTLKSAQLRCGSEDLQIFSRLGTVLGSCDAESQSAALEEAIRALSAALEEAREQRDNRGRVYVTLSASCGLLLVILLI